MTGPVAVASAVPVLVLAVLLVIWACVAMLVLRAVMLLAAGIGAVLHR
ncbi:hypothetical protein ACVGOW_19205 [Pseudonocardia saturnea]